MNQVPDAGIEAPANLSTRIYSDLRQKLISGELGPSQTLSIRTLAEDYDISTMPVREALRQLASESALVGAAKKAYRVPSLTSAQAADLFFVRAVLESAAAEIAAQNVQDSDIEQLHRYNDEIVAAWECQNKSGFLLANFRFHRHIYALSGNSALPSMIDDLYVRTGPWLSYGITNLIKPGSESSEHEKIIDALQRRDKAEARRLVELDAIWGVSVFRELD